MMDVIWWYVALLAVSLIILRHKKKYEELIMSVRTRFTRHISQRFSLITAMCSYGIIVFMILIDYTRGTFRDLEDILPGNKTYLIYDLVFWIGCISLIYVLITGIFPALIIKIRNWLYDDASNHP